MVCIGTGRAAPAEERAAPAEECSPSAPSAQPERAAGRARSPSPNAAQAREGLNARKPRRCGEAHKSPAGEAAGSPGAAEDRATPTLCLLAGAAAAPAEERASPAEKCSPSAPSVQPEPERAEAGPLVYELSALRRPVGEILASAEAGPLIHELSALRRPVGEILAGAAAASAEERAAPAERSPSAPSAQPDRAAGRARSPSPNAAPDGQIATAGA